MLTDKQERFVLEYLIDSNATQAAKRAGYSEKTANRIGGQNLSKLDIRARIDEHLKKIESDKIADAAEVLRYLTGVMRGETQAEVVVIEGTGNGESEAKTIMKKPDEKERLKAAEMLGKKHGMFTDKVEHTGQVVVFNGDDKIPD